MVFYPIEIIDRTFSVTPFPPPKQKKTTTTKKPAQQNTIVIINVF